MGESTLVGQSLGSSASGPKTKRKGLLVIVTVAVIIIITLVLAVMLVTLPTHRNDITETPAASIAVAGNSSGYWFFTIGTVDRNNIGVTDCEVRLTVGNDSSSVVAIPQSLRMTIPINSGNATGYTLNITDVGSLGYISAGDEYVIGPINNATGTNAYQLAGTKVTLQIIYAPTGGVIASKSFTL
jgi:hypothetical protein